MAQQTHVGVRILVLEVANVAGTLTLLSARVLRLQVLRETGHTVCHPGALALLTAGCTGQTGHCGEVVEVPVWADLHTCRGAVYHEVRVLALHTVVCSRAGARLTRAVTRYALVEGCRERGCARRTGSQAGAAEQVKSTCTGQTVVVVPAVAGRTHGVTGSALHLGHVFVEPVVAVILTNSALKVLGIHTRQTRGNACCSAGGTGSVTRNT